MRFHNCPQEGSLSWCQNFIHPVGLGRVYPGGPGSLWFNNLQLQMSPPHSTGREMKTNEDEGSVRPGLVNLRWSHIREGSGGNQTPLDLDSTSSWILFG